LRHFGDGSYLQMAVADGPAHPVRKQSRFADPPPELAGRGCALNMLCLSKTKRPEDSHGELQMKNTPRWLLLAFALATGIASAETAYPPSLSPTPDESRAAHVAAQVLTRYHYRKVPLDADMSEKIFDRYLKVLDGQKLFFTQADIDRFAAVRTRLGEAITHEDLGVPFAIFNLYERRVSERFAYARELLKAGFDFKQKESLEIERDKEPWAKSEDELRDVWRKRVKNDWLRLKLAGQDDKAIRATLDKRYENSLTRNGRYKSDDVFQTFLDAYATSLEPHTNYLGPRASEDFDISMKLSLVGIGAVLQERNDYTTVRDLVPGGPAARSGKFHIGDRIVGVGQGAGSTPTDVIGWRLDDVVRQIRGAKDSVVLLDVLPVDTGADGKHELIALVRDKISLEQQAAKKSIIAVKNADAVRRIGVIALPTFYQDFEARRKGDKDYRSATRDVSRLLGELKKEQVDSVLIDLRNNGGGSLDEAIELTGLFIDKGPVVQRRDADGTVSVESDENAGTAWDGPLGVLINRGSASASEIFAAAMQDYGRGLIIGEPSFGKGTVQTIVSLDQLTHNEKPTYGELKMTVQQFFRIDGGTTQLRGVRPDIVFPGAADDEGFGESSFDNALPWTSIKAAAYKPTGDLKALLPALQRRFDKRAKNDRELRNLEEDLAEFAARRKQNSISLNEDERRKERSVQEARLKSREENGTADAAKDRLLRDDGLQANERSLGVDLAAEKAQKEAKDVLLDEASHILADEVDLVRNDARLAAQVRLGAATAANQKPD
jgi:carboxyl-terminal processing protease